MATNAPKDNLLPIGASPEDLAAQSEARTAAVAWPAAPGIPISLP